MKVKITRSTVLDGSVWFPGNVADLLDDIAQLAIRQGVAEPLEKAAKDEARK